ncbi:outer membrane protein assembly factor BamD [Lysobacter sp. CA199]|uniref:outer membrane protein assembly factor BamD n=1 Tax=Lysobacter sp. CA199 TaxID=3455608 RepID=UPI003F8D6202
MTVRSAPSRADLSRMTRLFCLLLLVAVAATGCKSVGKMFKKDKDADEGQPVEAIYEKAHKSMTNGNWASAEVSFKRLVAQYPYGPYTEQALIETAYAQYKSGKHDDAVSSIDRFIRTYPTHRNIAYLYYLRGLVNSSRDTVFLQKVWRLDVSRRDLATPMQAYNDFLIVAERYPNSRYAEDSRKRMMVLRDTFARHELDVSLYYLRRTALVAAVDRAKYLLETYPQSRYQNDAVAVLLKAYEGLDNPTLAADAKRVLQQNDAGHPALTGKWPDYPSNLRKLNPFAGEKSAVDNRDRDEAKRKQ